MESLCGVQYCHLRRPLLPSFSRSPPPLSTRLSSLSFSPSLPARPRIGRPHLSLRASGAASHSHSQSSAREPRDAFPGDALLSVLRPACVAFAAGAALFFARLQKPLLAFAIASPVAPAAQSEIFPSSTPSTGDPEDVPDVEKEKSLEDYLASHPDDTRALRALMEIKIKSGKLPEAVAIVDRLIVLEPGEKDLPLLKAHIQSYGGNADTAQQGFEELLQKDPLLVEAYHGLVMAAWQSESEADLAPILKRIEGAMELCKKEKRKDDLRDFKLLVAQVKVLEGDYNEALKVYQDMVKEEPRDFRPYLCQGIVYTLLRKKDEAEKQFQKYRRLVPKEHPYAQYFDENMVAMKVFSQIDENKRTAALKR
ncbi:hypothetical protein Taro_045978 [Colocasia esculenta]|uniref:Protein SLOW GREEN 1, chloroplastic n=1 Tax=Colocasia esculenta TaxID=4460 RepID=A0A843X5I8_COLES|nr:hypothetical protein [Colocasia esculenta]